MEKKDYLWIIIMFFVLLLDQLTKLIVKAKIPMGSQIKLLPFFSLSHHLNTGAGFGLFKGANMALLVIGLVVLIYISWKMPELDSRDRLLAGILIGGIIGNVVDRAALGGVTDFLLVYVNVGGHSYAWPSFNIADSAIFISIFAYLFWKRAS